MSTMANSSPPKPKSSSSNSPKSPTVVRQIPGYNNSKPGALLLQALNKKPLSKAAKAKRSSPPAGPYRSRSPLIRIEVDEQAALKENSSPKGPTAAAATADQQDDEQDELGDLLPILLPIMEIPSLPPSPPSSPPPLIQLSQFDDSKRAQSSVLFAKPPKPAMVLERSYRNRYPSDHLRWTTETLGVKGMKNRGNTCYIAAVLQCWAALPKFVDSFKNEPLSEILVSIRLPENYKPFTALVLEVIELLMDIWDSKGGMEVHIGWLMHLMHLTGLFDKYVQQDAHEFHIALLQRIGQCMDAVITMLTIVGEALGRRIKNQEPFSGLFEAHAALWNSHMDDSCSPSRVFFDGLWQQRIRCFRCKAVSTSTEWFSSWSLQIEDDLVESISLESLIEQFYKPEGLIGSNAYHCQSCDQRVPALRRVKLARPPRYLLIQLKRFSGHGEKIMTRVSYPVKNLQLKSVSVGHIDVRYNLVAICMHEGSMDKGHYTAITYNKPLDRWFEFDDDYVLTVDEKSFAPSHKPYMFYYELDDDHLTRLTLGPKDTDTCKMIEDICVPAQL